MLLFKGGELSIQGGVFRDGDCRLGGVAEEDEQQEQAGFHHEFLVIAVVEYWESKRLAYNDSLLAVWLAVGWGSSLRGRDRTTCGSRSHSAPCRPTDSPDGESPVADTDALPARALRWSPDSSSDNRIPARR